MVLALSTVAGRGTSVCGCFLLVERIWWTKVGSTRRPAPRRALKCARCTADGQVPLPGSRARLPRLRRGPARDRAAARPAAEPAHARAAGARAGRARQPGRHARPARPRAVGPAAGHVALRHGHLRRRRSSRCSTTSSVDEAVVGGTSLGANITLEVGVAGARAAARDGRRDARARQRAARLRVAFTPLMVALTAGEPLMKARVAGRAASSRARVPWAANILLDTLRQDPGRAPPCSRACSPAAPRRTAPSGARSTRPRW